MNYKYTKDYYNFLKASSDTNEHIFELLRINLKPFFIKSAPVNCFELRFFSKQSLNNAAHSVDNHDDAASLADNHDDAASLADNHDDAAHSVDNHDDAAHSADNQCLYQFSTRKKKYEIHEFDPEKDIILPSDAQHGDLVANSTDSNFEYRMSGMYHILNVDGTLHICRLNHYHDDYGCITSCINAAELPCNWDDVDLFGACPHKAGFEVAIYMKSLDYNDATKITRNNGDFYEIPVISSANNPIEYIETTNDEFNTISAFYETSNNPDQYCIYVVINMDNNKYGYVDCLEVYPIETPEKYKFV